MSLHKQGKVLRSDARTMVYNVIKYFEEEKRSKRYHPYKHSNLRAALATGLSASTISKIRKEGTLAEQSHTQIRSPSKGNKGRNNTRVPTDVATLCNIKETIAALYDSGDLPTIPKIIAKLKKDFDCNLSQSTLRRILKNKLGFRYKKSSQNRKILMESNTTKAWRTRYLRRIRKNDVLKSNKKKVLYIGQSIVDVNYNKIKGKKNIFQTYFLIQVLSENGYILDATSILKAKDASTIDNDNFLDYVKEKLVPILPENCLIVLNNTLCHTTQVTNALSSIANKEEIKKWMVDNYIPFEEEWTKAELLTQLKSSIPEKKYVLDELLKNYNHEIIRLPPNGFELNPLERIWDKIKERVVKLFQNDNENEFENIAKDALALVTKEEWKKEMGNVKTVEKKYWLREVVREDNFEEFMSSLGVNTNVGTDDEGICSSDESVQGSDSSIDDDDDD